MNPTSSYTVANFRQRLPAPARGGNDSSLGAVLYGHGCIGHLVDDLAERWRLELVLALSSASSL